MLLLLSDILNDVYCSWAIVWKSSRRPEKGAGQLYVQTGQRIKGRPKGAGYYMAEVVTSMGTGEVQKTSNPAFCNISGPLRFF